MFARSSSRILGKISGPAPDYEAVGREASYCGVKYFNSMLQRLHYICFVLKLKVNES
jgi:hypothetical protein